VFTLRQRCEQIAAHYRWSSGGALAAILKLETVFEGALIVLGLLVTYVSWGYGFGTIARPGPGLYPFFLGVGIALFALLVLAFRLRRQSGEPPLSGSEMKTLALMSLTFCFWVLAMPLLGYVVVTLLCTCAFAKVMKLEGWRKPVALAAGTAGFIYVLFDHWLYIDLPRGIFG
jgi:putative tricarboxylic transport membrane protein